MALFVIIGHDVANSSAQRKISRPAHLKRIVSLQESGRLVLGGPTPIEHGASEMSGSIIVADFDNLQEAQTWCNEEPYLKDGVYSHVDVKPFLQVFPNSDK